MEIRNATPDDAEMLARLHVQAWSEAYTDLLPASEHAARGLMYRFRLWSRILASPVAQVAVAPDLGFAQVGPQRDKAMSDAGYPLELYSLYVLEKGYGTGTGLALLKHALGPSPAPFSAFVLDNNPRACGFYEKNGGRLLETRDEWIGQTPIRERAYVWDAPITLPD